jgi:uncharacterized membrane protein (UPF0127 family)
MRASILSIPVCLALCGCESGENVTREFGVRIVRFPNGGKVTAEVMQSPEELGRGMMFRKSLTEGRGMLFLHAQPGPFTYWMYNVEIPLDMIFMDQSQRVVHIERNAQPCKTAAKDCPQYGPDPPRLVQYILELGGGQAERYGLKTGDTLRF